MSSLPALQAKRGELEENFANAEAARQSAARAAQRAENNLQFTSNPAQRTALQGQISQARAEESRQSQEVSRLRSEIASVDAQIADTKSKQGAQASAGQQVKESQTARDDGASPTNPPPPTQVAEDGRVVAAQDRPASNAQRPEPGAVDVGTNAPVRRVTNTQGTPPITAQPGPVQGPTTGAFDQGQGVYPGVTPGTASAGDDNPGGTGVRARLNNLFGGKTIEARDNILDQYASYTYNISVYLMSPRDYVKLLRSKKKTVAGFQLLFMSGGAGPSGSVVPNDQITAEDPLLAAQERIANLGRNEFFSLDYYIDDVRIKTLLSGKGTRAAHNAVEMHFKVIEPNGITFLDNLFAATQQYIQVSGGDINKNYAAQNYLMVIRFYGYDSQGNLVKAGTTGQSAPGTDINAIAEKFIPFQFTSIKFRIANKIVEYDCHAVTPQDNVGRGVSRGSIPYNIELQAQTLQDLLTGQPKFAANDKEGRVVGTAAQPPAGVRSLTNIANETGLGQTWDAQGA